MTKRDAGFMRKEYHDLCRQMSELAEIFCATTPLWRGTVYLLRTQCGRPSCHCATGTLHELVVLSDRSRKPYRTLSLRPSEVEGFRPLTEAYRQVRKARVQLVAIHKAMLKIVDGLTEVRLEEGKRRAPSRRAKDRPKKRR